MSKAWKVSLLVCTYFPQVFLKEGEALSSWLVALLFQRTGFASFQHIVCFKKMGWLEMSRTLGWRQQDWQCPCCEKLCCKLHSCVPSLATEHCRIDVWVRCNVGTWQNEAFTKTMPTEFLRRIDHTTMFADLEFILCGGLADIYIFVFKSCSLTSTSVSLQLQKHGLGTLDFMALQLGGMD